jgi:hypothetical protein
VHIYSPSYYPSDQDFKTSLGNILNLVKKKKPEVWLKQ